MKSSSERAGTKGQGDQKIIWFTFAGRQRFLEIQKTYIFRLLNQYEFMQWHLWDFSRNREDHLYLRSLAKEHPRVVLFDDTYQGDNSQTFCEKEIGKRCDCVSCRPGNWSIPYLRYAAMQNKGIIFIKGDDDLVYIDTTKFSEFVKAIRWNRDIILSANVINNGVVASLDPIFREQLMSAGRLLPPGGGLKDWWAQCTSRDFFFISHETFLAQLDDKKSVTDSFLSRPRIAKLPKTRFSINMIGLSAKRLRLIARQLELFPGRNDEEVISMNFKFGVHLGFRVAHFSFADQSAALSQTEREKILRTYREIATGIRA